MPMKALLLIWIVWGIRSKAMKKVTTKSSELDLALEDVKQSQWLMIKLKERPQNQKMILRSLFN